MTTRANKRPFIRHALILRRLLSDAWSDVSSDRCRSVVTALQNRNVTRALSVADSLRDVGRRFAKRLRKPVKTIIATAGTQAVKSWHRQLTQTRKTKGTGTEAGTRTGIEKTTHTDTRRKASNYQQRIEALHAEQVLRFSELFPDRVLHPEIERQVNLIGKLPDAREIDVTRIAERVGRILSGEQYWNNLSMVQVGRLWHADGVALARDNGVQRMQVVGIPDDKMCPVCHVFHGSEFDVDPAMDKIDRDLEIKDPDEYVTAWRFPRFHEIQLMDQDEVSSGLYMPPFHCNCRCSSRFLINENAETKITDAISQGVGDAADNIRDVDSSGGDIDADAGDESELDDAALADELGVSVGLATENTLEDINELLEDDRVHQGRVNRKMG